MRLHEITTMEEANALVPGFIETWNKKFAVPPRDANDAHRPWTKIEAVLDEALARHE